MSTGKTSESIALGYDTSFLARGMNRAIDAVIELAREQAERNDERMPTATWPSLAGADGLSLARALIETYRNDVKLATPQQAARLLTEIARLYEDVLEDRRSAFAAAEQALALDPTAETARRVLLRLIQHDDVKLSTEELSKLLGATDQGFRDVNALIDFASFVELKRGDLDRATEFYRAALSCSPGHIEAQEALQRLYLRRDDRHALAESYIASAHTEDHPLMRCSLLLAAVLAGDHLDATQRARLAAQALDACPRSTLALHLALHFHGVAGNQQAATEILTQKAEQLKDPSLYFQLSRWAIASEARMDLAIAHAEVATQLAPRVPFYLNWLGELYRRAERWEPLTQLLRDRIAGTESLNERLEAYIYLADILASHLASPKQAIAVLNDALKEAPTDLVCLRALGQLYAQLKEWPALVEMHLNEAAAQTDRAAKAQALYRSAHVLAERLDKKKEAIKHLTTAGELDSENQAVSHLLADLYRKTERYKELVHYLESCAAISSVSAQQRLRLYEQIALYSEHHLSDLKKAIAAQEQILTIDAGHRAALRALPVLFGKTAQWSDAFGAYRSLVEKTDDPDEKAEVLLQMGRLAEDRLNDTDLALTCYRESLDLRHHPDAFEYLGRLYAHARRWSDLVRLYRQQLSFARTAQDRARMLFRIGLLEEHELNDPTAAVTSYGEALEADASLWPALRGLARVARNFPQLRPDWLAQSGSPDSARDIEHQAALLTTAISLDNTQPDEARSLLSQISALDGHDVLRRFLLAKNFVRSESWVDLANLVDRTDATLLTAFGQNDRSRALKFLEDAIGDADQAATAYRWLDQLSAANNDLLTEARALTNRQTTEHNQERREAAQLRLALLAESQSLPDVETVVICRDILKDNPRHVRALDLLERVARQQNRPELLLDVMEKRAQGAPSLVDRIAARSAQASAYVAIGDEDRAVMLWRECLAEDPTFRPAYEGLKRTLAHRDDTEGLLWTLDLGVDAVAEPRTQTLDLLMRADLRASAGRHDEALADLKRVLKTEPEQPNALDRVERICRDRNSLHDYLPFLSRAADLTPDPARQSTLLFRLALIQRNELTNWEEANRTLLRAIQCDPDNVSALLLSADIQLKNDQPMEALALFNRAALRAAEPTVLCAAHLGAAFICNQLLGDPLKARTHLQEVLAVNPDHLDALRQHAHVSLQLGDVADQERCLRKIVDLSDDRDEQAKALVNLAVLVFEKEGQDASSGAELLEQALLLTPGRTSVLNRLIQVYQRKEQWAALEQLLATHSDHLPEDRRADMLLLRGRNLAKHLANGSSAREVLRQVIALDPKRDEAYDLLLEQYDAETLADPAQRTEAIMLHRRVLERSPDTLTSLKTLRELCQAEGRIDEAFNAEACLVVLNQASEEEAYFFKQRRIKQPTQAKASLTSDMLTTIALPRGEHPLRAIMKLIGAHLSELMPNDLSTYGIDSLEHAAPAEADPAYSAIVDCTRMLGVKNVRVVQAGGGAAVGSVEPGTLPCLIVPNDFSRLSVPQQRFLAGRLLARVALDTILFDVGRPEIVAPRDVEVLLAALIRSSDDQFGADVAPRTILSDLAQRAVSLVDNGCLADAVDLAKGIWSTENRSAQLDLWMASTESGACRAGLLCCGRLDVAAAFLERMDGRHRPRLLQELLRFSTSAQYAELRAQLGLSIT